MTIDANLIAGFKLGFGAGSIFVLAVFIGVFAWLKKIGVI